MDIVDISVRNPVKVVSDQIYTTYEISVKTSNIAFSSPNSVTRRRFSEFCWLRKKLKVHHPQIKPPELPRKTFFAQKFDPEFISIRMKSLEEFITRCFEERLYFSDSSLHLFIQSDLSCSQIEDYLGGRLCQGDVDESRTRCQANDNNKCNGEVTEDVLSCGADLKLHTSAVKSEPQSCPPSRVTPSDLEDAASSGSGSVSDSLDSDMYLSCAVGPGSIQ